MVLLGLALTVPALAEQGKPKTFRGPRIAVEPARFDFGEVLQNRTLEKEFFISNHGSKPLQIQRLVTDCGCTAALIETKDKTIEPGGRVKVRVTLQTRRALGRIQKRVLVRSNDTGRRSFEIKLQATVVSEKPNS
jgi:hypothetical protein